MVVAKEVLTLALALKSSSQSVHRPGEDGRGIIEYTTTGKRWDMIELTALMPQPEPVTSNVEAF